MLGRTPQVGLLAKLLKDSGQRALSDTISDFTGKPDYQVGDISRAAIRKLSKGVAMGVSEFTGKSEYHFGDISKAALEKITGKSEYHFGDISRAAFTKMGSIFSKHETTTPAGQITPANECHLESPDFDGDVHQIEGASTCPSK